MHSAGPSGTDTTAVSQLDAAQAELEAGNAALLQGAPFLVEMLALQAAAPGMQPVRPPCTAFGGCLDLPSDGIVKCQESSAVMLYHVALEKPFPSPH